MIVMSIMPTDEMKKMIDEIAPYMDLKRCGQLLEGTPERIVKLREKLLEMSRQQMLEAIENHIY
jgi:uncharacterized protein YnzC (UPF0291/DUF896 family)